MGKLGIVNDHKILPQEDCNAIKDDVLYLLTFAVENLKALETKPEGTPNFVEHTAKIEWAVNMAANYKTFNKVLIRNKGDNLSSKLYSPYPKKETQ